MDYFRLKATTMKTLQASNKWLSRKNQQLRQQSPREKHRHKILGETKATFQEEEEAEESSEEAEEEEKEEEEAEEAEEVEEEVAIMLMVETNTLMKREKIEEKSTKISLTRNGTDKTSPMEDSLTNKVEMAGEVIIMEIKNMEEEDTETEILRRKWQRTSLLERL